LFSGLGSIVLLFGVLFSQLIREVLVRAATSLLVELEDYKDQMYGEILLHGAGSRSRGPYLSSSLTLYSSQSRSHWYSDD